MRLLAIDAAHGRPSVAALDDGRLVALHRGAPGPAFGIAVLAEAALKDAQWTSRALDAVVASVGPGSFTGIRAALALAHGIALVAGIPVIGVTTAEAYAAQVGETSGRSLWVATDTRRRGTIYLEREGNASSVRIEQVASPDEPILLAGDAAAALARALRARGVDVVLAQASGVDAAALGRAALARRAAHLPPRPPMPLYVDPPAARLPTAGLPTAGLPADRGEARE